MGSVPARVDTIPLITHRGCPFQCVFCSHNSGFKPRYRTPANVLDEIEQILERYRPTRIRIEDETFGLHMGRTKEILEGIIERGFHHRVRFSAQTRVDRVDEEFIRLLKTANFETLELGVETGNPEILRKIKKGITLDQVEHAVGLAKANGLRVWCKFILGHPDETPATIRDTIDFIAKINPDQLSVSIMTPFPGTPIHEMAVRGEGGYRLLSGGWEDFDKYSSGVLELETVSLGRLKRYQIACYLEPLRAQPPLPGARAPRRLASRRRVGDGAFGGRADCARDARAQASRQRVPRPSPRRRHSRPEVVHERRKVAQVTRRSSARRRSARPRRAERTEPRARPDRRRLSGPARSTSRAGEVERAARVAQVAVRDELEQVRRADAPQHPPRSRISQQCSNMRIFRRYSSSMSRAGFSHAIASGSTTARRPRCTIRYGNARSWPKRGSSSR